MGTWILTFGYQGKEVSNYLTSYFTVTLTAGVFAFASPVIQGVNEPGTVSKGEFKGLNVRVSHVINLAIAISPATSVEHALRPTLSNVIIRRLCTLGYQYSSCPPNRVSLCTNLLTFQRDRAGRSTVERDNHFHLGLVVKGGGEMVTYQNFFNQLIVPKAVSFFQLIFHTNRYVRVPSYERRRRIPRVTMPTSAKRLHGYRSFSDHVLVAVTKAIITSNGHIKTSLRRAREDYHPKGHFSGSVAHTHRFYVH